MASTTLLDLSDDVLLCIIDAIESEGHDVDWSLQKMFGNKPYLKCFSATCKRLRGLAMPRLFRTVAFHDFILKKFKTLRNIEGLLATMCLSPGIQGCIRYLKVESRTPYKYEAKFHPEVSLLTNMFLACTRLEELHLDLDGRLYNDMFKKTGRGTKAPLFPNVRKLTINEYCTKLLVDCPQVQELVLRRQEKWNSEPKGDAKFEKLLGRLSISANTKSIRIENFRLDADREQILSEKLPEFKAGELGYMGDLLGDGQMVELTRKGKAPWLVERSRHGIPTLEPAR